MFYRIRYTGVCFFICIVIAFGCSSENRELGYVYFRLNINPSTLDPALIVDVNGGILAAKLFNGLVKLDETLQVQPDIAETWSVSNDGTIYLFKLKRDITFSNHRAVTAGDFLYSFERILHPQSRSPNTWVLDKLSGADAFMRGETDHVDGIRVVDDYTLELRLSHPFSPFLNLLAMPAAYVVPYEEVKKWGPDFSSHPVGTGPFVLKEWLQNRAIRLIRRDDYHDETAKVDGIIYRIIPEDLTAVTEFEIGNLDVLTIPASEYARIQNDERMKHLISSQKGLNTYYIGFNCSRRPFNSKIVRKAVSMAIDRQKILETIFENRGRLASGPVPDTLRNWTQPTPYKYDQAKARSLLSAENMQEKEIFFYITADQEIVDIAEIIQWYLQKVGLRVTIRQLEWSAFKEATTRGEADLFYLSWWADYSDPENFLFPLFHSANFGSPGNRTRYANPIVDVLIEKGQYVRDMKSRESYYMRAEKIIVDDAPWVFLWHRNEYIVRNPWIKNYKTYPIYSMDKGTEIRIETFNAAYDR